MYSIIWELIRQILKQGNRKIKIVFIVTIALILLAISSSVLGDAHIIYYSASRILTLIFGMSAALIFIGIVVFSGQQIVIKEEKKIEDLERKYEENPAETKTAWDLARIKLESYLNRNLKQIQAIFILTVVIMIVGFVIIGYGIYKVYDNPENLSASVLVTFSGILVNFIGATFLVIYKSTMTQAKEYVAVLERINAVGMSIQILEKIQNNSDGLKDKTSAEISKELLKLYGLTKEKN
jgi:hypothetical protein